VALETSPGVTLLLFPFLVVKELTTGANNEVLPFYEPLAVWALAIYFRPIPLKPELLFFPPAPLSLLKPPSNC